MSAVVYIPDADFFPPGLHQFFIFFIPEDIAMILHTTVWDLELSFFGKCAQTLDMSKQSFNWICKVTVFLGLIGHFFFLKSRELVYSIHYSKYPTYLSLKPLLKLAVSKNTALHKKGKKLYFHGATTVFFAYKGGINTESQLYLNDVFSS